MSHTSDARPAIGLALSGGGFRAAAFGLGCLRALHDRDLLSQVRVVSGISGGSLLSAMWAYGPTSFHEFDDSVTTLLRRGMQWELVRRVLSPSTAVRSTVAFGRGLALMPGRQPREATRTDALVDALTTLSFGSRDVADVPRPGLDTVISATDLASANAVRFGSARSSCSAYGRILDPVTVAEAVAASAAFPVLLPALTRTYEFESRDGRHQRRTISMTDGGVYDNLGLSPLLPGRGRAFTSHVYELDYLIAVDSGRGRATQRAASYLPSRLKRSFDIAYNKAQDGGRAQLNAATTGGRLQGFVHAYLGMRDSNLPAPVADFVQREAVIDYPTDFAAVPEAALRHLTLRGEQLTRILLAHYCPDLGC